MMNKNHANSQITPLATKQYEETMKQPEKQNETYGRARLRNWHTGKPQEILLVDWNELERALASPRRSMMNTWHELFREGVTSKEPAPELKKDVRDALRLFSPIEQRILFRVIVQGQSFEVATARMRASAGSWRKWYAHVAVPLLREKLADYQDLFRAETKHQEVA
jgi:hypothetical protein